MIILDIETSGLDFDKCGIWQIGAIELENLGNQFFQDARIDETDIVTEDALKITGKKEQDLRDIKKQSQEGLIKNFFMWAENLANKNCVCQNPQFDMGFLWVKSRKYNLEMPFKHRAFDLHSIGALRYFQINGRMLLKDNQSSMGLFNILKFVGMLDDRKTHNALEDAKLTAECFFRLFYGKNLFSEYSRFNIPNYLRTGGEFDDNLQ